VEYQSIEKVEVKTNFSKGDLISGIIIAIISICTLQVYGLLFTALLLFCSYGKQIVITRKDSSRVFLLTAIFQKEETDRLIKLISEKTGRQLV
jgi:ACR3 family arsenite efflux pump ArsB